MSRRTSQIRLYPNSFPREGPDSVEFHSSDPIVFMMWLMETLGDLQKTVLRNMRLLDRTRVIRMTYRFPAVLLDRSCRYRILDTWTSTPGAGTSYPKPKVQAPMTADSGDMEPPHVHTGDTESDGEDPGDTEGGGGSFGFGDDEFVGNTPVSTRFLLPTPPPVPDLSTVDIHFHMLDLDAME
ncbi:hypothetical protein PIB30_058215 [Stylosanthes scabra]|uniref:Uncharacterized protein n=1 Tax=Stylosanthes scabra TaxID=79078 RepID=A0ABU6RJU4_9FABA|nr:hypothetical protein [Stylosanthes scabra]